VTIATDFDIFFSCGFKSGQAYAVYRSIESSERQSCEVIISGNRGCFQRSLRVPGHGDQGFRSNVIKVSGAT
jgi:hypothetical protein